MAARARLSVLCDNEALPGFAAEWGLSLHIRTPAGQCVLWDSGKTGLFLDNAARLGLDLSRLDAAALSHGHYDHGDGLPLLRSRAGFTGPVHVHPDHGVARFAREDDGRMRSVGLSVEARHVLAGFTPVAGVVEIVPGLAMLSAIPHREGLGTATAGLFLDCAGTVPDPLPDDACLVLDTESGPVLILGCCHSGLANTLAQVRDALGLRRLTAAVGGLHLYAADAAARTETRDALREMQVETVFPGHCTGRSATDWLARELPGRVAPLAAGQVLEF
jgi:7,8-dihydropterin-6-yl-methyl-4-(beta-D-ribofuranosyl)aminobenzene 5'-phosphate synthase